MYTDRHAYLAAANVYRDSTRCDQIDWPGLQARNFKRDPDDPERHERYQAEALVHRHLPIDGLQGIICHGPAQESHLRALVRVPGHTPRIVTRPEYYFR